MESERFSVKQNYSDAITSQIRDIEVKIVGKKAVALKMGDPKVIEKLLKLQTEKESLNERIAQLKSKIEINSNLI